MYAESPLPSSQMAVLSLYSHMADWMRAPWTLLIWLLISFMRVPPSSPNHLPKTQPLNTITLRIRFVHMNWEVGDKHSPYSIAALTSQDPCPYIQHTFISSK